MQKTRDSEAKKEQERLRRKRAYELKKIRQLLKKEKRIKAAKKAAITREIRREQEVAESQKRREERALARVRAKKRQALNKFIKKAISLGRAKQDIRRTLIHGGWPVRYTDELLKSYKEKIKPEKITEPALIEKQLKKLEQEIKTSKEYIEKEIPKRYVKPVRYREKAVIKKPAKVPELELPSKQELEKLSKLSQELEQKLKTTKQYIEKELPGRYIKSVRYKIRNTRKILSEPVKPEPISAQELERLSKLSEQIEQEIKSSKDYIEKELPRRYAVVKKTKKLPIFRGNATAKTVEVFPEKLSELRKLAEKIEEKLKGLKK